MTKEQCLLNEQENKAFELNAYKMLFENLNTQPDNTRKIPAELHHIWLTNCSNATYINNDRIQKTVENINILEQDNYNNWNVNIWSNCPDKIQSKMLSGYKVNYKNIKDLASDSDGDLGRIGYLIENQHYGMASDFLRYLIIQTQGGFYADIGFDLYRAPALDLYRYDFFANQWEDLLITNNFFAAKENFPSVAITANITRSNIDQFIQNPERYKFWDKKDLTTELTAEPINKGFYSYLLSEQSSNFIHAVIPHSKFHNGKNLVFDGRYDELDQPYQFSDGNICAADFLFIGQDELKGETWL